MNQGSSDAAANQNAVREPSSRASVSNWTVLMYSVMVVYNGVVRVLVACEFSGRVRDAFARRGHDAWSVDLLPSERPGQHRCEDVRSVLGDGWDLMVAFPPCTYLCRSGARWYSGSPMQAEALEFVRVLLGAPVPRICLENPIGAISSKIRKPDQIVEPYFFGEDYRKATCLWLKGLPELEATCLVRIRQWNKVRDAENTPDRWKERSRTVQGMADAMADQWG
jgi:hypothetical protein